MSAYLVRLVVNKEPVGVFFCTKRDDELFWMVDEITDPYGCECAPIRNGFVAFPNSIDEWDEISGGDEPEASTEESGFDTHVSISMFGAIGRWTPITRIEK